jgi:lyso-ornithine lipid O-acyltransferase
VRVLWLVLRSVWRSSLLLLLLVAAVMDWWVRRPAVGAPGAVWIHGWSRRIVECLGFRCEVEGQISAGGAVVSNHLSYLDILMYSSVRPFVMVAKTEVRGWPLFGWITSRAGTVYVERGGGPKTYPRVNAEMAEAYRSGLPVLFFPEGTTTDGMYEGGGVMPFRRGLFHSVLNNGVPLRVAALRYSLQEENGGASVAQDICWWGDMLFAPHMFAFLGLRGVRAEVRFGPEIMTRDDRFVLSEGARAEVVEMYGDLAGVRGYEGALVEVL